MVRCRFVASSLKTAGSLIARSVSVILVLGFVGSCVSPATQGRIELDTDVPAGRALTLTVTVRGEGSDAPVQRVWRRMGAEGIEFPSSFGVVPATGRRSERVVVVADLDVPAAGADAAVRLRRTASFSFIEGRTVVARMFLSLACGAITTGCATVAPEQCTLSVRCEELGATCGEGGRCVTTAVEADAGVAPTDSGVAPDVVADTFVVRCGDGVCSPIEDCRSCSRDCGECPCPASETRCGSCVDTTRSDLHCGRCNNPCPAGSSCAMGVCVDPCASNTCSGHGWCEAGRCICDPGYQGSVCSACGDGWVATGGAPQCAPMNRVLGTGAGETVMGTAAQDYMSGLDGNDTMSGLDGFDFVSGNADIDQVNGNTGRDEVHGGAGGDTVMGGSEDDAVFGDDGDDVVIGGMGNDRLIGGPGADVLQGGDGDDRYVIDGLGNDTIDDSSGTDAARGVPGVRVASNSVQGTSRVLRLSNGATVTILRDAVERVLCP